MTNFPNITCNDFNYLVAIDTETYCPAIKEHGHSFNRGGYICGVSVACEDGAWYWDIRNNPNVMEWLKDLSENFAGMLIGTNLQYDLLYFKKYGIEFKKCSFWDISLVECLIDENQKSYSLDSIAKKYLGVGKTDDELYTWLANKHGGRPVRKEQAGKIHLAPEEIVRPYAISDVELPMRIQKEQANIIKQEELDEVLNLEMRLLPILVDMRYHGIKVDLDKATKFYSQLLTKSFEIDKELKEYGVRIDDVYGADSLSKAFDKVPLKYPSTETGKASFTKSWTSSHSHPLPRLISEARKVLHFKDTFVDNYILKSHIDGRIHCQYNQLRGDQFGTITGRLSASYPNLQNIPARDEQWSKLIRSIFVPEDHEQYLKVDYSQIEFRLFAHYSQSNRLIKAYNDNPDTDYHDEVAGMLENVIRRKIMKNFNFMKLYGGGKGKTVEMLKTELNENEIVELLMKLGIRESAYDDCDPYELAAHEFINKYDASFPEAKGLMKLVSNVVKQRGYVRTISGRRKRFDLWKPSLFGDMSPGLRYNEATNKYGHSIERAYAYKGLNNLDQGSAADIIKMAIIALRDKLNITPLITVHDELGFSINDDSIVADIKDIMENVVKLRVPVKAVTEISDSWS